MLRGKLIVIFLDVGESKVANVHGKSFIKEFEVAMDFMNNNFCDKKWYLDVGASQHVIEKKVVRFGKQKFRS